MNVSDHLVVFAHGKESGPWGTKITRLAETARKRGFDVISPDYSHTHDPRARVAQLLDLAPRATASLVLVGSSMGGYVSAMACAALKPQGLLLMAPALYFPGFDEEPPAPPAITAVVHGWKDDIVPVDRAIRYARHHHAALHLLDAGHTLNDRLPELVAIFDDLLVRATLLGAYRRARYIVKSRHRDIELGVERSSPECDAALAACFPGLNHWAFISAGNPMSQPLPEAENAMRLQMLREHLKADGIAHLSGYGDDRQGRWLPEASELLCNPPPGYAESLARDYGQNAILRGCLGEASEIHWLR